MITSLADLTDAQKADMVASLSIFLAASGSAEEGEELITPAKLQAIASASGNSLAESLATLFASVASNAPGGVLEAYMPSPGGGGGGGYVVVGFLLRYLLYSMCDSRLCVSFFCSGGGGGGAAAEEAKEEEAEEEEEEADIGGGMDMFGGGDGGDGGDY